MTAPDVTIVIPTLARPSLGVLLQSLAASVADTDVPPPVAVHLVDDRRDAYGLDVEARSGLDLARVKIFRSGGRGPAAARNLGWRAANTEWIAFLDDDVVLEREWWAQLRRDLLAVDTDVAAVQATIVVPADAGTARTDFARTTAALQSAKWITADMAVRRSALVRVGGFDERFPRAYREDSDLALRLIDVGYGIERGVRTTLHPVRPSGWWVSVRQQAGNADNALMRRKHGRAWRRRVGEPTGRFPLHALTTAAGAASAATQVVGRRTEAVALATLWLGATAEFAASRVARGAKTPAEVAKMITTSVVIPPVAVAHRIGGELRHRHVGRVLSGPPQAVLFDRDGTLIRDEPYNGDPRRVVPVPGAREALDALREAGIKVGVITNQSGVGRGLLTPDEVAAVNDRVEQLLGPFDDWQICLHTPEDGCECRKPAPGMVHSAAHALGVDVRRCAVVGDIDADVRAAEGAGAFAVLVPNEHTRPEEVEAAAVTCHTISDAVALLLVGASR